MPDGDVIPCLPLRVGNLRESSLRAVWNGAKFREFRRKLRDKKLFTACQTCCYGKVRRQALCAK